MLLRFRLTDRRRYPVVFSALSACVYGLLFCVFADQSERLVLPVTGLLAGLGYFFYAQHLQETRLFVDIFRQFNNRYNELNEDMNRIRSADSGYMLSIRDKQYLFDYFNLCAEEYLYFKSGYIDNEVWRSWRAGMAFFAESKEIRRLWEAELISGSYYGFSLADIAKP